MTAPPPARGLILQPSYRIEAGRPVVHLWGKLESGEPFLLRDSRAVPHFYVAAADVERARALGARTVAATNRVTLDCVPAARVEVPTPADTPPLRDRLADAGIPCYEADVRFGLRYLIDRRVRGAVAIGGEGRLVPGLGRVFDDPPEVGPADPAGGWVPALAVLSIDIETDPRARRLLSVALHGCGAAEVLLVTPRGHGCPPGAVPFGEEGELIAAFCRRVRELDPDVITGWNVEDFDLAVLDRLARRAGLAGLELGRGDGALRLRPSGRGAGVVASVPGRLVLDGPKLLRGAFVRMDSYGLDAVAREVLGEGKVSIGEGSVGEGGAHAEGGRAEEILRMFGHDRPRLVEYNLNDARLAAAILEKMKLVELAVERTLLTGLPPDRVAGSIAAFDLLYLTELGRRGVVAPTVRLAAERAAAAGAEATGGGHVLEPEPGLWDNVLVFDFKSLYPSLIRTFNIDPLGFVRGPGGGGAADRPAGGPIVAPNGAAFGREPGILPSLLDELFPRREAAKAAGDGVKSYAIKILMNSFYGVLGTPACRFYNPKVANAITSFGRELLLWTKERIEREYGHRVLYGDTDSLFVDAGSADPAAARDAGRELLAALGRDLAEHVASRWRVESRLELEFERLYRRLFLPPVRGGDAGARKRYAGLVEDDDGTTRVVLTGMEAVRRDWTELAHRVQRELYERLFHDRPVEEYLHAVVADLRAGRVDPDDLVYRKGLRKPPAEYTATTPAHVAAARKLPGRPPRVVSYIVTTAGPEPVRRRAGIAPAHPPDYEHYVDKQIRPVAEPVLDLLGLEFAKVIGDDRQMELPLSG